MGEAGIVLALDAFADRTGNPHLSRLRARRRRSPPAADRERGAPAAARIRKRDARDRLPLRLGRRRLHVPRALRARPRSRRSRDGAPSPRAGSTRRRSRTRRAGFAGRSRTTTRRMRRASSSARPDRLGQSAGGACDRRPRLREVARRAGIWLRPAASMAAAGRSCGRCPSPVHVGLDSGAAGIGWVLDDLARAGLDPAANRAAARAALARLRVVAARDRLGAFWYENRMGGRRGCVGSRPGTGAPPASPRSLPGLRAGPAAAPAARASCPACPIRRAMAGRPDDRSSSLAARRDPRRCSSNRPALPARAHDPRLHLGADPLAGGARHRRCSLEFTGVIVFGLAVDVRRVRRSRLLVLGVLHGARRGTRSGMPSLG